MAAALLDARALAQTVEMSLAMGAGWHGADAAVMITDADATDGGPHTLFVNQTFESLTGYRSAEVIGRNPDFLKGPRTESRFLDRLRDALADGHAFEGTAVTYCKDGRELAIHWSVRPVRNAAGHVTHFIAVQRPMTYAETAGAMLASALAAGPADDAGAGELLRLVNHELRTPLNAIIGFSDLLRRQGLGPVGRAYYQEFAEGIFASGNDLLRVLSRLVEFAKPADEWATQSDWIAPRDLAATAIDAVSAMRRHTLSNDVPDDLPQVRGDRQRLTLALGELCDNAARFGGGARARVRGHALPDGRLRLTIIDHGPGMTRAAIERAFRPFAQLEDSYRRRNGGLGIGLPLARRIIEDHRGRLHLRSAPNRGTAAIVVLPAHRAGQRPPSGRG